jgi:hypothetical protein
MSDQVSDEQLRAQCASFIWPEKHVRVGGRGWKKASYSELYAVYSKYPIEGYLINRTCLCKRVFDPRQKGSFLALDDTEDIPWGKIVVEAECAVCGAILTQPWASVIRHECPCLRDEANLTPRQLIILETCATAFAES